MKISEIRAASKMTQPQFAVSVGVSVTTVSNWEKGDKGLDDIHPLMRKEVERFAKKHKIHLEDCEETMQ